MQHVRGEALVTMVISGLEPCAAPGRRERRDARRRLRQLDTLSARLAELHSIGALLDRAAGVVRTGWVQSAWFAVAGPEGERTVTAGELRLAAGRPVTGACLVGAVVHAAGGPATARTQLVQRTLDLTWHALHETPDRPVRWCPGPGVRRMMLLELTRWNDEPGRTRAEVLDLLRAATRTVDVQRGLSQTARARLALATTG